MERSLQEVLKLNVAGITQYFVIIIRYPFDLHHITSLILSLSISSNYSTDWSELERNLREVLELSVAGIPLVSVAGCGSYASQNDTKFLEELCTRWYQMAAYMPALYSFYQDDRYSRLPSS